MLVLTFISASGGTGKTTLAINTAAQLAIEGKRVLFIDFDNSATATRVLLNNYDRNYTLPVLMKRLIDAKKGRITLDSIRIEEFIFQHKIPQVQAVMQVIPGGDISSISTDIKSLPEWGRLLREVVDLVMSKFDYEPTVIIDSPNWVYEFFEMTMYMGGYYIAITRPSNFEVRKFIEFLKSISSIIKANINGNPSDLIYYVINQYRSNMRADEIRKTWNEIHDFINKELPGINPLINEKKDNYYSNKEKSEFLGFKYRDDFSLDLYMSEGPILARRKRKDNEEVIKQFKAYYDRLMSIPAAVATG